MSSHRARHRRRTQADACVHAKSAARWCARYRGRTYCDDYTPRVSMRRPHNSPRRAAHGALSIHRYHLVWLPCHSARQVICGSTGLRHSARTGTQACGERSLAGRWHAEGRGLEAYRCSEPPTTDRGQLISEERFCKSTSAYCTAACASYTYLTPRVRPPRPKRRSSFILMRRHNPLEPRAWQSWEEEQHGNVPSVGNHRTATRPALRLPPASSPCCRHVSEAARHAARSTPRPRAR